MARTIAEYESLISRLEESSTRNPRWYLAKVVLLAGLGYGYIAGAVLLSLALIAALGLFVFAAPGYLSIKLALVLGIPLVLVVWGTVKALRVRFAPPEGDKLHREDYPELFERIDRIRRELDGPRVHEVLLTSDFNAAIVGVPRLGILGWYRNYLILGLPLLSALSPEELDAVIGHEMGHLSGNHGKISGWIYRIRATWEQLAANIDGDGGFLFRRFFGWFIPYFNAYSFVLARRHEYEADEAGASVTSADAMGSALTRIEVVAKQLDEEFWPGIIEANKLDAEPPGDLYDSMRQAMTADLEPAVATSYLREALDRRPGLVDTHPSLEQRLDALGLDSALPDSVPELAGEVYLGERYDDMVARFSEQWRQELRELWAIRHEELSAGAERLAELETKLDEGEDFEEEEMWEYAGLIEQQHGSEEVLPVLYDMLDETTEDLRRGTLEFHIGRILLERTDIEGIEHLDRAMELNHFHTLEACELIVGYHFEHGERTDAQRWVDRASNYQAKLAQAQQERSLLSAKDTFIPADLSEEKVEEIKEILEPYVEGHRVYLVEKVVEHFPEEPCYILGLSRGVGPLRWSAKDIQELANTVVLPIPVLWFDMGSDDSTARTMRKVPDGRIF